MLILYWIIGDLRHNSKDLSVVVSRKEIPNAAELKMSNDDSEVYKFQFSKLILFIHRFMHVV